MKPFARPVALAIALLLGGTVAGCGTNDAGSPAGSGGSPASTAGASATLSGTLTVFAAASLTGTFTQLATDFEAAHPGAKVSLSFDGSSTLATQIIAGAPADVFASADTKNMTKVVNANLIAGKPVTFATNRLEIAVPPANPANITSFADLARPGVKVVVCAAQVPCGAAARADEASAGVTVKPVSEELNVTSVLGKVIAGEADAGLVYVTDVHGAGGKVKGVPVNIPRATVNSYPIAGVSSSKRSPLAAAFIAFVTGAQGQAVLKDAGFGAP
ncbi:molybdate ABC transporter substrate-binding protein [Specibacter cremeus]|uniref:molybdate ABC transporter substrate-binding protein n=1 Tax=Specibacter cremeus TaxID=1629051 RepID=UPI000F78E070|nr:molybdate ABC transporter substrate-binding protein [Specibacter cremeus]